MKMHLRAETESGRRNELDEKKLAQCFTMFDVELSIVLNKTLSEKAFGKAPTIIYKENHNEINKYSHRRSFAKVQTRES